MESPRETARTNALIARLYGRARLLTSPAAALLLPLPRLLLVLPLLLPLLAHPLLLLVGDHPRRRAIPHQPLPRDRRGVRTLAARRRHVVPHRFRQPEHRRQLVRVHALQVL